jgi:protein ImuA
MPGVGFPRWNVNLLKVRNGKPGSWEIEWAENQFQEISQLGMDIQEKRK